jgi:RNA recognition motif-containing protein
VEFKEEKDAEEALAELQGKELGGLKLSIEWSKKSGKFDPKSSTRPPSYTLFSIFNI